MKNKIITIILFLVLLTLTSCSKKVISISLVESTVPSEIAVNELEEKLSTIKISVEYKKGEKEEISLDKSMIASEDYAKLSNIGTHQVKVNYEKQECMLTLNITNSSNAYQVTVLYPDKTPVKGSVMVQWCEGELCYTKVEVDANGVAVNNDLPVGTYSVHLDDLPEGYTYNPNNITTESNKSIIVELIPYAGEIETKGTVDNLCNVTTSCYTVTFDKKGTEETQYFSFTASKTGKYVISSYADESLSVKVMPVLGFFGTKDYTNMSNITLVSSIKDSVNFSYEFDAIEGETYVFIIQLSKNTTASLPGSFLLNITEK